MKFSCEQTSLSAALSVASRTVSLKSAISALEGIYLKAGSDLQLTGYNLETGITVHVEAEVSEVGECVLPARLFCEIIRKLPDGIVHIRIDELYTVTIRGGISTFSIKAASAEDYPELPEVEATAGISIPQTAMRELISGTIFSVSDNQARPVHTGCLIEADETGISMIAVDGFRLARRTFRLEEPCGKKLKFVVPAAALKELEKILSDSEESVAFTLGSKHILFRVGSTTLVCRILEGDFLDWRRVVPNENPIKLTANVMAVTAVLERVNLIISEKIKSPVRCVFSENVADFRTVSAIGTAHDRCELAGNGKEVEIGFNCRYLLEALRAVPSAEVMLELSNGLSPIVLTPCDEKYDFSYMVLPVRLKPGD